MMRRSVYSTNPKWASPIIEILWDKSALAIEAKAGTLDIKAIGPMFQQALKEITEAIIKGKQNAKTQDSNRPPASEGTEAAGGSE
jgi:hypothetical protein